jgi:hypothetical protein
MLTKNGIRTSIDIVIIGPTRMDLLHKSCATQGFVTSDVTQAKK